MIIGKNADLRMTRFLPCGIRTIGTIVDAWDGAMPAHSQIFLVDVKYSSSHLLWLLCV